MPYAIESGPFGYQATVDPACIDAVAFEEDLKATRAAATGAVRARRLRAALTWWGGGEP